MRVRLSVGSLLLFLLVACGPDAETIELADSACAALEAVQDESFDPTQLDAYNSWFAANESELNSSAVFGGSADYEQSLQDQCGPVVESFAVKYEDHTGTSFWHTSEAP